MGLGLLLVGTIWLLGEISTILVPVIVGTIAAAVAGPLVDGLERRKVPRAGGAALVLLMLLALGVVVFLLVLGGIVEQGDQIKAYASQALDKAEGWVNDAGANDTSGTTQDVSGAVKSAGSTLVHGLASGIEGLTSLAFFLSFALFSTFFLLKDFSSIRGFVDTHLGIPLPVATTVTTDVLTALRRYFLGVTIVAIFNGTVVGLGAWALGVPLAGTIAVVTFVTAYVPFIGAFVSGAFAVILALAAEGTQTAVIMLVIVLLANGLLQNVAPARCLRCDARPEPARRPDRDDRRRRPLRHDRADPGRAADVGGGPHQPGPQSGTRGRSSRAASRRCRSSGRHLASAHQNHTFALAGVGPYRVGGVRGGAISPRNPQHEQAAQSPTTRKVTPPFELLPSKLDSPAAAAGSRAAHRGPRSALPRE